MFDPSLKKKKKKKKTGFDLDAALAGEGGVSSEPAPVTDDTQNEDAPQETEKIDGKNSMDTQRELALFSWRVEHWFQNKILYRFLVGRIEIQV